MKSVKTKYKRKKSANTSLQFISAFGNQFCSSVILAGWSDLTKKKINKFNGSIIKKLSFLKDNRAETYLLSRGSLYSLEIWLDIVVNDKPPACIHGVTSFRVIKWLTATNTESKTKPGSMTTGLYVRTAISPPQSTRPCRNDEALDTSVKQNNLADILYPHW